MFLFSFFCASPFIYHSLIFGLNDQWWVGQSMLVLFYSWCPLGGCRRYMKSTIVSSVCLVFPGFNPLACIFGMLAFNTFYLSSLLMICLPLCFSLCLRRLLSVCCEQKRDTFALLLSFSHQPLFIHLLCRLLCGLFHVQK